MRRALPVLALEGEWSEPPGTWKVASAATPVRPLDSEETRKVRRTVEEMRWIATAVEAFAVDCEFYPPAGTGLWKRLVPTCLRRFPTKDPWGNAYRYETGPKRDHYVLSSSGGEEFSRLPESYFREVAETGPGATVPGSLAGPQLPVLAIAADSRRCLAACAASPRTPLIARAVVATGLRNVVAQASRRRTSSVWTSRESRASPGVIARASTPEPRR